MTQHVRAQLTEIKVFPCYHVMVAPLTFMLTYCYDFWHVSVYTHIHVHVYGFITLFTDTTLILRRNANVSMHSSCQILQVLCQCIYKVLPQVWTNLYISHKLNVIQYFRATHVEI